MKLLRELIKEDDEKLDWQDDIDDRGVATGVCPKCGGNATYNTSGKTLASAAATWKCDDCGLAGKADRY